MLLMGQSHRKAPLTRLPLDLCSCLRVLWNGRVVGLWNRSWGGYLLTDALCAYHCKHSSTEVGFRKKSHETDFPVAGIWS